MDDTYSDLSFKLQDGSTIPAHRCVISVQSPAWAGLLKSKMKETNDGIILLQDFPPELGRAFLRALYCCSVSRKHLVDVLALADCYQIGWLVERCIDEIVGNLDTPDDFAHAFNFIRLHPAPPDRLVQHIFVKLRNGLHMMNDEQLRVMFGIGSGFGLPDYTLTVQSTDRGGDIMEEEKDQSLGSESSSGIGNIK